MLSAIEQVCTRRFQFCPTSTKRIAKKLKLQNNLQTQRSTETSFCELSHPSPPPQKNTVGWCSWIDNLLNLDFHAHYECGGSPLGVITNESSVVIEAIHWVTFTKQHSSHLLNTGAQHESVHSRFQGVCDSQACAVDTRGKGFTVIIEKGFRRSGCASRIVLQITRVGVFWDVF